LLLETLRRRTGATVDPRRLEVPIGCTRRGETRRDPALRLRTTGEEERVRTGATLRTELPRRVVPRRTVPRLDERGALIRRPDDRPTDRLRTREPLERDPRDRTDARGALRRALEPRRIPELRRPTLRGADRRTPDRRDAPTERDRERPTLERPPLLRRAWASASVAVSPKKTTANSKLNLLCVRRFIMASPLPGTSSVRPPDDQADSAKPSRDRRSPAPPPK
jgi:hypothetical protein